MHFSRVDFMSGDNIQSNLSMDNSLSSNDDDWANANFQLSSTICRSEGESRKKDNTSFINVKLHLDIMSDEKLGSTENRLGLSIRQTFWLIKPVLRACGADETKLIFSPSTVYRRREKARLEQSCHAKDSINKSLLYAVHWDGKKIRSYKNESENRIVIITGPGKEILPQLVKTFGKCQADAVFHK